MGGSTYIGTVPRLESDATAGDTVRMKGTADGYLITSQEVAPLSTVEHLNISVAAASASGTDANPAAASSYAIIMNEAGESIRVAIGETATASNGILLYPNSGLEISTAILMTAVSIYNISAGTAANVSIMYAR